MPPRNTSRPRASADAATASGAADPAEPVLDVALSRAILTRISRGELAPVIRLYRPAAAVQFGRVDQRNAGFGAACRAAADHGYAPLRRVVGGHAAAHDTGSLVFEHFSADKLSSDLHVRFEKVVRRIAAALTQVGLDARVGELPGEYCPGAYSVNSAGTLKVGGLAQRVVKDAALTSAVVVVAGGDRIRAVLTDVYRELAFRWRPETAGAIEDHLPGIGVDGVARAILDAFADHDVWSPDDDTFALSAELAPSYRVD